MKISRRLSAYGAGVARMSGRSPPLVFAAAVEERMKIITPTYVSVLREVVAVLVLAAMVTQPAVVTAGGRVVTDDLGFRVEITEHVRRIVSLVPTNSEMVCLLDCDRLKGGTRYDDFPRELAARVREGRIEIIGGGFDVSLEKIVLIDPDLILANGPSQQKIVAPLKRMGYPVLSVWPRDLHGLKQDFLLLGKILGQNRKAKNILDEIERGFAEPRG